MEMAAGMFALLTQDTTKVPKVVDIGIDYLSPGRLRESYAECQVIRHDKKIINVQTIAWQETKKTPIAQARVNLLLQD